MTTVEVPTLDEQNPTDFAPDTFSEPEVVGVRPRRNVAGAVLRIASRLMTPMPTEAPDYMSEHFGYALHHNDPNPALADYRG